MWLNLYGREALRVSSIIGKKCIYCVFRPFLSYCIASINPTKGTSIYYVITKGGGRGSAKCLRLLTWGEGGLRGHAYVIIVWRKILPNLHNFFQAIYFHEKKILSSIKHFF